MQPPLAGCYPGVKVTCEPLGTTGYIHFRRNAFPGGVHWTSSKPHFPSRLGPPLVLRKILRGAVSPEIEHEGLGVTLVSLCASEEDSLLTSSFDTPCYCTYTYLFAPQTS